MAKIPPREPFNPERSFVLTRPLTINGKAFALHEPFDKTLVTARRLRQMYDSRRLAISPEAPVKKEPPGINLDKMSDEQLTLLLEDNGIIVRPNASRKWLMERSERHLRAAAGAQGVLGRKTRSERGDDAQNAEKPL